MSGVTDSTTLLVRNLPPDLSQQQISELLLLFKATSIKYTGNTGRMRHCAFATFPSQKIAAEALRQLHQLTVLNFVLRVEYAKRQQPVDDINSKQLLPTIGRPSNASSTASNTVQTQYAEPTSKIDSISKPWGLDYTADDSLSYLYPAPSESTLQNIVHCMASVPRFYVQVLHLMNKMHLPPPFGELTTSPPVARDSTADLSGQQQSLSEESELESSDEERKPVRKAVPQKRSIKLPSEVYAKRLRSQLALTDTMRLGSTQNTTAESVVRSTGSVQEVFDVVREQAKQMKLHLPAQVTLTPQTEVADGSVKPFGMMDAQLSSVRGVNAAETDNQSSSELRPATTPFITSRELANGRLSEGERNEHSILKKHTAGEPYTRLYVKNLAKQTTDQELKYIFGRYVNWNDENEAESFDIRHMTEGRMKGQAFISLPHVEAAEAAVTECHAYVLNGKPMAVAFAKPKPP